MRLPILAGVCATLSCGLAACGDGDRDTSSKPADKAPAAYAANITALTKPGRSNADFVQAIRSQVKLVDGMLLVTDATSPGIWVLSINSPWMIQCGPLMSLIFGGAVTGSSEAVANEVEITLSLALLSADRCRELAPLLGKEMNLILSGQ